MQQLEMFDPSTLGLLPEYVEPQRWHATWETDRGLSMHEVIARTPEEADEILRGLFPQDAGGDGYWINDDGDEYPINW